mmetsp:Transcript_19945/g.50749  ORF Transcript_19945/g.50749 Transcript_19945/m.50749 type:complete len:203 (+) Transcript_19945:845-1453(+)
MAGAGRCARTIVSGRPIRNKTEGCPHSSRRPYTWRIDAQSERRGSCRGGGVACAGVGAAGAARVRRAAAQTAARTAAGGRGTCLHHPRRAEARRCASGGRHSEAPGSRGWQGRKGDGARCRPVVREFRPGAARPRPGGRRRPAECRARTARAWLLERRSLLRVARAVEHPGARRSQPRGWHWCRGAAGRAYPCAEGPTDRVP